MIPNPRRSLHPLFLIGLALLCLSSWLPSVTAQDWKIVQYQNRDYVTAKSLAAFYGFAGAERSGSSVYFRSKTIVMKGRNGSQDFLINNVKFVLSYPLLTQGGEVLVSRLDLVKLIDPVLRPKYIKTATPFNTVILDAGHGGHDSGAKSRYGYEKNYSLQLARKLRTRLELEGFKVVMTRDSDIFISLEDRVRKANSVGNAIFLSLHFNSGAASAKGIETFALPPVGSSSHMSGSQSADYVNFAGNGRDSENIVLATAVHASVMNSVHTIDRGIKRARWAVLKGINKPAILFEGGFLTNGEESRQIAQDRYHAILADSITKAVVNYRTAVTAR